MGQLLGRHTLLGHVLDVGDRQRHTLVLGDRHPGPRPHERAVTAQVALLQQVRVGDAQLETRPLRGRRTKVVGMRDLADADPHQRRQRSVQHVGERLVGVDDATVVEPHQRHPRRRRVERLLEPTAGLLQRHRRTSTVGHVTQQHDESASPSVRHGGPVERCLDQVGNAFDVDELEHDVVADRAGDIGARVELTCVGLVEVPPLRHRLTVVVTDHLQERAAHEFVDRAPGQHRCSLVRRLDHAAVVQPHDRVGQVVEQPSDLGLGAREFTDRASEAATDPSGFQDRGDDGHQCERCDTRHQADGLGTGIGTRSHPGQHDQRCGHRHDRQDQPPGPVLAVEGRQLRAGPRIAVVEVACAGVHRYKVEPGTAHNGAFPTRPTGSR